MAASKEMAAMVALVAALLALNMSGVVTVDVIKEQMKHNKKQLEAMGLQGNLALGAVDIAMIVCCSPMSFALELYAGWIYGLQVGVATILIAKNLAACLCFFLGKTLLRGWVSDTIKKSGSFKSFHRKSGESGWSLVLAGRLSPLPSYVCNYGFSITDVSLHDYVLATLLAGAPMVFQNVYMGSLATQIEDLFNPAKPKDGSVTSLLFKFGFPFIGTFLIVVWFKSFLGTLADDATSGRLVTSRQSSPAATTRRSPAGSPAAAKPLFSSPAPRGRPRAKSPAPPKSPARTSKSPAPARGRSPAKKTPAKAAKTPAKAAARTPSPRRTRQTPRK